MEWAVKHMRQQSVWQEHSNLLAVSFFFLSEESINSRQIDRVVNQKWSMDLNRIERKQGLPLWVRQERKEERKKERMEDGREADDSAGACTHLDVQSVVCAVETGRRGGDRRCGGRRWGMKKATATRGETAPGRERLLLVVAVVVN